MRRSAFWLGILLVMAMVTACTAPAAVPAEPDSVTAEDGRW